MAPFESWKPFTTWCSQIDISVRDRQRKSHWNSIVQIFKSLIIHSPTASTLFSRVSSGTGLPDCSMSFHSPVTPIANWKWLPSDHADNVYLFHNNAARRSTHKKSLLLLLLFHRRDDFRCGLTATHLTFLEPVEKRKQWPPMQSNVNANGASTLAFSLRCYGIQTQTVMRVYKQMKSVSFWFEKILVFCVIQIRSCK